MKKNDQLEAAEILRQKAEELLRKKTSKSASQFSDVDFLKLISELEVHQIELELQNEELILARSAAQDAVEKYAELYDFAPSGYFTLSKEGRIIELNLHGAEMLGKDRTHLRDSLFGFFVSDDTKPNFNLFLDKIFSDKTKESCEVTLSDNGNLPMYVHLCGNASDNGENCLVTMVDITERKQAEEKLQKSYDQLNKLAAQVPGVIYQYRLYPDGRSAFPYSSPGMYDIYEVTPEEVREDAAPVFPRLHPDDLNYIVESINESARNQTFYHSEFRVILPKQGLRWRICDAKPELLEDGSTLWHGIITDITEKMRADQVQHVLYTISNAALSTKDFSELIEIISEQLRKLLDSNNFFIAFYDETSGMLSTQFDEDENDQINSWPAEKSATGYVIKHQKSLLAKDSDVLKLREAGEIEMIGTPSKVWLGVPLWINKKVLGVIVVQNYVNPEAYTEKDQLMLEFISHQISISIERKIADQELKEALIKAHESDRLKSAFLANMSHEIRTPMNGILGFAGLLKEPKLTGEEQQEYVSIIEKSGARMLNIINDIVDISKIESGQMEVNNSDSNINEQIEYIYIFFKPEVERKGMQLYFKNSLPSNEAILKTDKEKVYAILTNLVKNAIKYSDKGSIEIGYKKKDKYIEFYVKDTGIGIPEDRQKAVFDRFVQADIGDKRAYQGAGLGLSISKAYVEMLGGKIWVESEEEKGSSFYFTLPYNCEYEEKMVTKNISTDKWAENQINPEGLGLKILIAEDDETSGMLITIAIKMFGKEFLRARTGVEAVEACRNNPDIDLVLMDIKMPIMDGYEATRQIRRFNKDVIIIAQTAYALIGDHEMAIEAGCNDYIAKPFGRASLTVLLKKYF